MHCDVAVKGPSAWIIRFECDGDKASGGKKDNVATWGVIVIWVEVCPVVFNLGLLEEGKVVAVKM